MARPKKTTVDYFPHLSQHKTTIFILEQKYGNDGYAFWFKVLELLAANEGHYLDCNDSNKWEFLKAKTLLIDKEERCIDILNLLAKLGAIDKTLWEDRKIIWSQNFVDGIADVYKNRHLPLPQKPRFHRSKPIGTSETMSDNGGGDGVSTGKSAQSKVNKSKVNKKNMDDSISMIKNKWNELTQQQKKDGIVGFHGIKDPERSDHKLESVINQRLHENNNNVEILLKAIVNYDRYLRIPRDNRLWHQSWSCFEFFKREKDNVQRFQDWDTVAANWVKKGMAPVVAAEKISLERAMNMIQRTCTTDMMLLVLRSLSPADRDEIKRHCQTNAELKGVWERAMAIFDKKAGVNENKTAAV